MIWFNFTAPFRLMPIHEFNRGGARGGLWILTFSWLGCEFVAMSKAVARESIDRLEASIEVRKDGAK